MVLRTMNDGVRYQVSLDISLYLHISLGCKRHLICANVKGCNILRQKICCLYVHINQTTACILNFSIWIINLCRQVKFFIFGFYLYFKNELRIYIHSKSFYLLQTVKRPIKINFTCFWYSITFHSIFPSLIGQLTVLNRKKFAQS